MPQVFDNIDSSLLPALQQTISVSHRADFCVGYFNLRGWKQIDSHIEWFSGGPDKCCRLLVGMQPLPTEELQQLLAASGQPAPVDNATAIRLKKKLVAEFRKQLQIGAPSNEDEAGLRRLVKQLKSGKVCVKMFLRHPLHAKLYLLFRPDPIQKQYGIVGSSNLTFAGLQKQGELNVDVTDHDACSKLAAWFEARWNDQYCIDISKELIAIIEESWAREQQVPPYHIYLKMAYHIAQEAIVGVAQTQLPAQFEELLFAFQKRAVKIASHYLHKRGGVLIGDVVGLGKSLMATALARTYEEDHFCSTLIICPKNLEKMWNLYKDTYGLQAMVIPITQVHQKLKDVPARFRLVLIDESHNLRNPEGSRYAEIKKYIEQSDSRVILLTATPYNKTYLDLAAQLGLFLPSDQELPIRPEKRLAQLGEIEFKKRYNCEPNTLAAFAKSEHADDWRELMRLYMIRRTRSFIMDNYAETEPNTGRKFLRFSDGTPSYFPVRVPKTETFALDDTDPCDQYARLYSEPVVAAISALHLPRYGLQLYLSFSPDARPTQKEQAIIGDLNRAGKRLKGFCRIGLFKRLESSGYAFLKSLERHILRNYVFLHALDNNLPLPIGTQDLGLLDERPDDEDFDLLSPNQNGDASAANGNGFFMDSDTQFKKRAGEIYQQYAKQYESRFRWLSSAHFGDQLAEHLKADARALLAVLKRSGDWNPDKDAKLAALQQLLATKYPNTKVLVFSQFADTVRYLEQQLIARGFTQLAGATGDTVDPTTLAWRFSPVSNNKRDDISPKDELRVLVATDVLSEGQNLQDAHVVVNFDLPWAIIRLIQRAGRVDRIGQKADTIYCHSFWPATGVDTQIRLRHRITSRLHENAEVVGSDELFFEDQKPDHAFHDLFTEKNGVLDDAADSEVDISSYAFEIWKKATDADPKLKNIITNLPDVVYSTKAHTTTGKFPFGTLAYLKTARGNDSLAYIARDGNVVTESLMTILKVAACAPDAPAIPRLPEHHDLVRKAVTLAADYEKTVGGQLGGSNSPKYRTYMRLKDYIDSLKGTVFESQEGFQSLVKALEEIYRYALRDNARATLSRRLKENIPDPELAELVLSLREEGRLCQISEEEHDSTDEPRIICSLGLWKE